MLLVSCTKEDVRSLTPKPRLSIPEPDMLSLKRFLEPHSLSTSTLSSIVVLIYSHAYMVKFFEPLYLILLPDDNGPLSVGKRVRDLVL